VHTFIRVEWAIPAFTAQPQSVTALAGTHFPSAEGRRRSWPAAVTVCVWSARVGAILPYEGGTFAAELVLLTVVAVAAMTQIRIGQFLCL